MDGGHQMKRIVIVGASGHGVVAVDAARRQGYDVAGFLDTFKPKGERVAGLTILGTPQEIPQLMRAHGFCGGLLGISDNWTRGLVRDAIAAAAPDFEFVTVVHPAATVAESAAIDEGTLVLAGAVINPGCRIGEHCIVNTRSALDHDSVMERFASLLPAATTAANVRIGQFTCVCMGTMIIHRRTIGAHSLIGAGAVVIRDIPPFSVAYGVPARVVRQRKKDERHMG
jgi:sugar O-acyltransferase (sialic acid O-acetyltransferase NeuD family)